VETRLGKLCTSSAAAPRSRIVTVRTARSRIFAGYALSSLSLGLIAFYLIGWATFDDGTWTMLFTSAWGITAAVSGGALTVAFWVWMLREYWRHHRADGMLWGVLLIAGAQLAATAYFLWVQRDRYTRCAAA
jgi:predicted anti-sigma-YlaC factor YlaD